MNGSEELQQLIFEQELFTINQKLEKCKQKQRLLKKMLKKPYLFRLRYYSQMNKQSKFLVFYTLICFILAVGLTILNKQWNILYLLTGIFITIILFDIRTSNLKAESQVLQEEIKGLVDSYSIYQMLLNGGMNYTKEEKEYVDELKELKLKQLVEGVDNVENEFKE